MREQEYHIRKIWNQRSHTRGCQNWSHARLRLAWDQFWQPLVWDLWSQILLMRYPINPGSIQDHYFLDQVILHDPIAFPEKRLRITDRRSWKLCVWLPYWLSEGHTPMPLSRCPLNAGSRTFCDLMLFKWHFIKSARSIYYKSYIIEKKRKLSFWLLPFTTMMLYYKHIRGGLKTKTCLHPLTRPSTSESACFLTWEMLL